MKHKILLVKLPTIRNENQYGIGKYEENGDFNFIWLRPEFYENSKDPIRTIPAKKLNEMIEKNQKDEIIIIGEIK